MYIYTNIIQFHIRIFYIHIAYKVVTRTRIEQNNMYAAGYLDMRKYIN